MCIFYFFYCIFCLSSIIIKQRKFCPIFSLYIFLNFAANGKTVDATQELIALGACNLLSSFVGSVPLSGGLSRGAVNHASGAKTTVGSIYAGKFSKKSRYYFCLKRHRVLALSLNCLIMLFSVLSLRSVLFCLLQAGMLGGNVRKK